MEISEAVALFRKSNPVKEVWQCQICGAVVSAPLFREYEPNLHCVHPAHWFGTEYDISGNMVKLVPEETQAL